MSIEQYEGVHGIPPQDNLPVVNSEDNPLPEPDDEIPVQASHGEVDLADFLDNLVAAKRSKATPPPNEELPVAKKSVPVVEIDEDSPILEEEFSSSPGLF